ncbi:MraW methylase [Batrachochytrium dendrobatidis JEL423]|uniref:MraW methylase n=1 Tax=Batrachochytrium dendrobatidis (strain JEL423) TaxID=403673 RepID=A0A177W8B5_BATDL|nr:MraW methylase [Batrachochytrium dendrobatidis JEL423]
MNITMRLQQRLLKHCNAFCPAKNLLQLSYLLHPIIQKQSISTLNPSSITKPDHKPVLLVPVVDILSPEFDLQSRERQSQRVRFQRPRLICDATFGNGGYTKALLGKDLFHQFVFNTRTITLSFEFYYLNRFYKMDCKVFCVDQDPLAIERAMDMSLKPEYKNRLIPIHGKFSDIQNLIAPYTASHEACLDGIVFDIGISSNQLDDASRGFSFRKDGPLGILRKGCFWQ